MFKNIVYSLITKGIVALINFLVLILSSKYLGVSSRGEISIFILNITIIQIVNEVYTGYSLVHFIPKFDFRKILGFGLVYSVLFCSLSNTIVIFLNKQVPGYEWIGYFISLMVIMNTFNCVLILGKENIKMYNFLSFIQPFLLLVGLGICVFILRTYTFASYIYPLFFSFLIAFVISASVVAGFFFKETHRKEFAPKLILANGFIFQAGILMYIFGNRYSYYLLPDSASVGLYASASSLMESVLIITNAISPVLLARIANQGNTLSSVEMTLTLSKVGFLFSCFVAVFISLLPESFFVTMMGPGFSGIKYLMLLYAPGVVAMSLFGTIGNYFSAIGKQKLVLLCYGLGFIATLLFAPWLIHRFGMAGAAYNASITYMIIAAAVCTSFIGLNKLSFRRFFSVMHDYRNLKALIAAGVDSNPEFGAKN
jgi:O-antigen/teichoic acid export membrane protein